MGLMGLSGDLGWSSRRGPSTQRRLERGFGQHGAVQLGRRHFQRFDQFVVLKLRGLGQRPALDAFGQQRAAGNEPSTAISLEPDLSLIHIFLECNSET